MEKLSAKEHKPEGEKLTAAPSVEEPTLIDMNITFPRGKVGSG